MQYTENLNIETNIILDMNYFLSFAFWIPSNPDDEFIHRKKSIRAYISAWHIFPKITVLIQTYIGEWFIDADAERDVTNWTKHDTCFD